MVLQPVPAQIKSALCLMTGEDLDRARIYAGVYEDPRGICSMVRSLLNNSRNA